MRRLTTTDVHAQKIAEIGLDPTSLDLTSVEALSSALRRAASFLCPCTAGTLVRSVVLPLRGLVSEVDEIKQVVQESLEALVAHGDILEQRCFDEDSSLKRGSLLYAAPPGFVARQSGTIILLGVTEDQRSALPDELESRIEYVNHIRRIVQQSDEDLRGELLDLGLIELALDSWQRLPPQTSASDYRARRDRLLDEAPPSRDIQGLLLLDPERPVRYYRGRWVEPRTQSGRFVARRSQAYGADLWCYVELVDGKPERLIDLPIKLDWWRGCDEAWHLQMAIDAERGTPQRYRVQPGPNEHCILEFFSPTPMWARRRLDTVGEPVPSSGCLFAYRISEAELLEEIAFAREMLWLDEMQDT